MIPNGTYHTLEGVRDLCPVHVGSHALMTFSLILAVSLAPSHSRRSGAMTHGRLVYISVPVYKQLYIIVFVW